jgi:hypothetical protein
MLLGLSITSTADKSRHVARHPENTWFTDMKTGCANGDLESTR